MKFERLGNIVKNLDNKRVPLNSVERDAKGREGLYPYIGANNIVGYIDEFIFDEKILCVAEDGGSWGLNQVCSNIYEGKTWVNNHAHVLVENGKAKLEYLKYYLNYANLNKYIVGTTRGKLTRTSLDKIEIPLPSLYQQIHIANILTKAENLIKQRKQSIALLDAFLKSTFLEMFGDPVNSSKFSQKTFKEISTVRQGLQIPISERKDALGENRFPYITNQFINGGKIAEYIENPRPNVVCTKEDVLMTRTGNTGIVLTDVEGVFHNNFFLIDYDRKVIDKKYLVHFLMLPQIKKIILNKASTTTIPDLNHGDFYKITIPIPPIDLQNQFAQIVAKTEKLKQQYQQSLQQLQQLFGSLSQQAFKGELVKDAVVYNIAANHVSLVAEPQVSYKQAASNGLQADELLQLYFICLNRFAHKDKKEEATLGEVKMEKTCHLAEYLIPELQFNRTPFKEEYGPADFTRLYKLHDFAAANNIFTHERFGNYQKYPTGDNFMQWVKEALSNIPRSVKKKTSALINILLPLNTRKIDVLATTFAAWNNLLILKQPVSLASIMQEGKWHTRKEDFTDADFQEAIDFLKANNLVPKGEGKLVKSK